LAVHKFIQFVYDKHYASTCQFDLLSFSYFFGRNLTLWKSKWNAQLQFEYSLSHCNKKWTYRHQFLYSIAWNCLSLHPGLCLALHRVLHRICFSNPMINLPRRDLNHNQPGKVAGWGSGGRGGGRG